MLKITLWLLVGMSVCESGSCYNTCPDGNICSDFATCCLTRHGYSCCPYPKAVCCSDLAHCCPSGFRCNQMTQMCEKEPWMNIPMVKKEATKKPSLQALENNHVPDQKKSSAVWCDSYTTCPNGYTCCRHPAGAWFCCPYSPGRCCLDGFHCCPYGFDCDLTYTHCVRQGLRYPFTPKQSMASIAATLVSTSEDKSSSLETPMTALTEAASDGNAAAGVIRCDSKFYCPAGQSCCKGPTGLWRCCPFTLGQCCADGHHCCERGKTCNLSPMSCSRGYSQTLSGTHEDTKTD